MRSVRIIGCGRDFYGDDAAGLEAARRLAALELPGVEIRTETAPGDRLIADLENLDALIIIDAAVANNGVAAGSFTKFDFHSHRKAIHPDAHDNTHTLSVATALELGSVLNLLPPTVWVYAIVGKDFEPGGDMSPEVRSAMTEMVNRIRADVNGLLERGACTNSP